MSPYDQLAENYEIGRIGYANELYQTLVDYGLTPTSKILDVACGTGLASRPFAENNYDVTGVDESASMIDVARANLPDATWVVGSAEALPFDSERFDVAMSAQAFHHLDRSAALNEMLRVLRPGGMVAVWWKHLMFDDEVSNLRESVARDLGIEPPPHGLRGGFKEFFAAPLRDHALRIIPWRVAVGLEQFIATERSRNSVHRAFGSQTGPYIQALETRLHERYGAGNPLITLGFMHYVYLGKK
jgi:SAM-dependent methyltransferase